MKPSLLNKILLVLWVIIASLNVRFILGPIKDFGQYQHLEYLTFTVPISIIISLLIILANTKTRTISKLYVNKPYLALATLTLVLSSTVFAINYSLSVYWLMAMAIYALAAAKIAQLTRDKHYLKILLGSIVLMGSAQAIIGISQFAAGHTLGLHILGEIVASDKTLGVAKVISSGIKLFRPVGLFPHANIFGGYLLITLLSIYLYIKKFPDKSFPTKLAKIFIGLILLAIFLSFSRAAWLGTTLLVVLGSISNNNFRKALVVPIVVILVAIALFFPLAQSRFSTSSQPEQFQIRENLSDFAYNSIVRQPFVGVGPRNFVFTLSQTQYLKPYELQPVHSSLLLLAAEFGVPFVLLLIILLLSYIYKQTARGNFFPLIASFTILPPLIFDHYLASMTLGLGLTSLFVVIMVSSSTKSKSWQSN